MKSFSQKSGWGFIQLLDPQGEKDAQDVFFHRADVARVGSSEVRAGILVDCRVVTTSKGEKASEIMVTDDSQEEIDPNVFHLPGVRVVPDFPMINCLSPKRPNDGLGFSAGENSGFPGSYSNQSLCSVSSLTHCPYSVDRGQENDEFFKSTSTSSFNHGFVPSNSTSSLNHGFPRSVSMASSSSMLSIASYHSSSDHCVSWECTACHSRSAIPSVMRVIVLCEPCGSAHSVSQWRCVCTHTNNRESRYCNACHVSYHQGCTALVVQSAVELEHKKGLENTKRGGWHHKESGWNHRDIGSVEESNWCQDNTNDMCKDRSAKLLQNSKSHLLWARDWLREGDAAINDEDVNSEWLYRFSEEVSKPEHRLVCQVRDVPDFCPNPCADIANNDQLKMYEAIGMALALAVASGMPLHPTLPIWMGRSLLGYPTSAKDLEEYDVELHQKVNPAFLVFLIIVLRQDGSSLTCVVSPYPGCPGAVPACHLSWQWPGYWCAHRGGCGGRSELGGCVGAENGGFWVSLDLPPPPPPPPHQTPKCAIPFL